MSFDRYSKFRVGNNIEIVPFVEISKSSTDMYETYKKGVTRLDKLSYEYYGNSDYAWLIMQANPQYGSLEYNIPDLTELRIPYPLDSALEIYKKGIEDYKKTYK
jgi:hypothetical protein